jgi:ferredoxin
MITKVFLDESNGECSMCGMCENICSDVFDASSIMKVKTKELAPYEKKIMEAVRSCPSECITVA